MKELDASVFRELADGLNHPEGVAWNPVDGHVWAGGEGGELYRVSLAGDVDEVASTGGSMLGLAVDGRGRVYACDAGNGAVVRVDPATGSVVMYAQRVDGEPLDTPNALAFDGGGSLYVTCSGEEGSPMIVRVGPNGDAAVWTRDVSGYPNGCAVTPDERALVVVEAHAQRIVSVPIDASGCAGPPSIVAELPGTDPDGVAIDLDGGLWVTRYRPDGIVRVLDGEIDVAIDDPLARTFDAPTNLAWVGPELDRAVVANVGDRFLSIGDLGVRGAHAHAPVIG